VSGLVETDLIPGERISPDFGLPSMNRFRIHARSIYPLGGLTAIWLASVFLCLNLFLKQGTSSDQVDERNGQRNERSTPRSFVLPATPGVAQEQEVQRLQRLDESGRCLARLRALGYELDDPSALLTARSVVAIFRFQREHGLQPTGQLSSETRQRLAC
jgi:Putative peptidoglycan binding domain